MDYVALAMHAAAYVCVAVTVASSICAMTPTPHPKTPLGKVYRAIEMLALVVGKAKDTGLVPADPRADKIGAAVIDAAKQVLGKSVPVLAVAIGLSALVGCAQIAKFEQQAGPEIAKACGAFHQAEADPLVQIALAAGAAASGGIVAEVKSFGDAFCEAGPPAGDMTSPQQQASWLMGVVQQMLSAAGVKTP